MNPGNGIETSGCGAFKRLSTFLLMNPGNGIETASQMGLAFVSPAFLLMNPGNGIETCLFYGSVGLKLRLSI